MKPIEENEIQKIEKYVNEMIESKNEVRTRLMTPKEAVNEGALALFGEKYGEEVRVLSMGGEKNKYFSTELCGGTHVRNTSEIGNFKITSQSSIASGVRRVEALRAEQLVKYLNIKKQDSENLSKTNIDKIKKIEKEIKKLGENPLNVSAISDNDKIKKLNKQLQDINIKLILKDKNKNKIKDETVKDFKIRFQIVDGFPSKELRSLIDQGKKDLKKGIVVAYTLVDGKVGVAVGVTKDLLNNYDAVELVKIGSEIIGGKGGGGRKDFAQAGGNNVNNIKKSFLSILKKIQ